MSTNCFNPLSFKQHLFILSPLLPTFELLENLFEIIASFFTETGNIQLNSVSKEPMFCHLGTPLVCIRANENLRHRLAFFQRKITKFKFTLSLKSLVLQSLLTAVFTCQSSNLKSIISFWYSMQAEFKGEGGGEVWQSLI